MNKMSVEESHFGILPEGEVKVYSLRNGQGQKVVISSYGATLMRWIVPDKEGRMEDVLLGFNDLSGYTGNHPYFGSLVGRYANRIAGGSFPLAGETYTLARNNGPNALHGGPGGFHRKLWDAQVIKGEESVGVLLKRLSPDGEEGYPGNLQVEVVYRFNQAGELSISYTATTDRPTPVNLTNHAYFNLKGEGKGDILEHYLRIYAERFTPVDSTLIPLEDHRQVEGTPFDFRNWHAIGERVNAEEEQIIRGKGYDHNFVLNNQDTGLFLAAQVWEPVSGRLLEVRTTQPGMQFYCGNFLDGKLTGKRGKSYEKRSGFCLETQHFPDSPNHPTFPSTVLRPGDVFRSQTIYTLKTSEKRP